MPVTVHAAQLEPARGIVSVTSFVPTPPFQARQQLDPHAGVGAAGSPDTTLLRVNYLPVSAVSSQPVVLVSMWLRLGIRLVSFVVSVPPFAEEGEQNNKTKKKKKRKATSAPPKAAPRSNVTLNRSHGPGHVVHLPDPQALPKVVGVPVLLGPQRHPQQRPDPLQPADQEVDEPLRLLPRRCDGMVARCSTTETAAVCPCPPSSRGPPNPKACRGEVPAHLCLDWWSGYKFKEPLYLVPRHLWFKDQDVVRLRRLHGCPWPPGLAVQASLRRVPRQHRGQPGYDRTPSHPVVKDRH